MTVNVCGIPHKVIECEDNFNVDTHFGQIDYKACEIRINKDMAAEAKEETICHEMIHGILVHLGYSDKIHNSYSNNPEKCILYLESLRALSKSDFLVLLPLFLEIYDGLCFNTLPLEEVQRVLDKYKEDE